MSVGVIVAGIGVFAVVSFHEALSGPPSDRSQWATITAAMVAVVPAAGLALINWWGKYELTKRQVGCLVAFLLVFTVVGALLGWRQSSWRPGLQAGCLSPWPSGLLAVAESSEGECYGLIGEHPSPGKHVSLAPDGFGTANSAKLERQLLSNNGRYEDFDPKKDLTAIWMGPLTCPLKASPTCADYPAERGQLRALLAAQRQFEANGRHLRVVIANAGYRVRHAAAVARMIVDHRDDYGARLAVIGLGDSRDATQRALVTLLDAKIPVIAPTLTADLGRPGKPFTERAGYFQMSPTNLAYAEDLVRRIEAFEEDPPENGFTLTVYQKPESSDQYTTSLMNDVYIAAEKQSWLRVRHARRAADLDTSVCQAPHRALFFADRWTEFGEFVRRLDEVCGSGGPAPIVTDGSVSRFVAGNELRQATSIDWPIYFYASDGGCGDGPPQQPLKFLSVVTGTSPNETQKLLCNVDGGAPYCTLEAAQSTSHPCRANDLGPHLLPTWNAVTIIDALLPNEKIGDLQNLTLDVGCRQRSMTCKPVVLLGMSAGFSVNDGRMRMPGSGLRSVIPVRLFKVNHLDRIDYENRPLACAAAESGDLCPSSGAG